MWFRKEKSREDDRENERPHTFDSVGLDPLLAYVLELSGVDHISNRDVMRPRIKLFCERREIVSFVELLEKIKVDRSLWQGLLNLLTVNETYFLREQRQLDNAVSFSREQSGHIDVLCAPCASGEEMYSLGILLSDGHVGHKDVSIKGIDINSEAIKIAKDGVYSQRAVHRVRSQQLQQHFIERESQYQIEQGHLCPMEFHVMNIFEPAFDDLGTFDIIFCRNMLIYFDEQHRVKAIDQLSKRLRPNGRLYLGHADLVPKMTSLKKVYDGQTSYYIHSE